MHKRDGVRNSLKLDREDPSDRIKYENPKLSSDARKVLATTKQCKTATARLRSISAKSKGTKPSRRSHPLVDDAAVDSDEKGGDIMSTDSTPVLKEVPSTLT